VNGFFTFDKYSVLYTMLKVLDFEVVIIGGGLAGLTAALHLSQNNSNVLLIEKYAYPHHKVCGEYVSNEVLPYLNKLGVYPIKNGAQQISKFEISNHHGKQISATLPLGGFGMSRHAFDLLLYNKLKETANVLIDSVSEVTYNNEIFKIKTSNGRSFTSKYVLGAWGKRTNLDKKIDRPFISRTSPWLGVKAHYEYEMPTDVVRLHNFDGGYCGLSKTESGAVNACYLTTYASFKKVGDIETFQQTTMSKNPFLKHFYNTAKPLFEKPLSISQISFGQKEAISDHILMIGDTAGLIHPLCGNGMAMAIHSAKIVSELLVTTQANNETTRNDLEVAYEQQWKKAFANRMTTGRIIQRLLMQPTATKFGFKAAQMVPSLVPSIIKKTHGEVLL
jgi:flavin-dependent dehydrogenase